MRILFLQDDRYLPELYAGVAVNTHWLALHLKSRGYTVAVSAVHDSAEEFREEIFEGYPLFRGARGPRAAILARERFKPDVLVNQNRALWPLLVPRDPDGAQPQVYYEHAIMPEAAMPWVKLRNRTLLAANSPMLAQHLRTRHGLGSLIVPPIFGISRFAGLACTPRHVTMVSIQRRKGADLALRLAARRPDVPFVFVESWTENKQETSELAQQLRALPNVRFEQNRGDMSGIWATTRLLLMPSRSQEAWGRVATECQLLGIPVLGSSRGSLRETIGRGGVTIDPDDGFELWSSAFDRLWDQASDYERCSLAARERAQTHLQKIPAATTRFEFLVHAATPKRWPRRGQIVHVRRSPQSRPEFDPADLALLAKLQRQVEAVATAPSADLPKLARQFAPKPSQSTAQTIARATGLPLRPHAMEIARRAAWGREEVILQCLRGLSPQGWQPKIELIGRSHLDEALARGRGAVLWVIHLVFASNVVKMALHDAGFRLSQLSRPEHGLSKTQFGLRYLNRARTDFEDRHLVRRIRFDRARPAAAMLEARATLRRNELVALTAGAWEGAKAVTQPFLGGTLKLATGPVRLASIARSTLLPVAAARVGRDSYEVRIEKPIDLEGAKDEDQLLRQGFAQFAAHVGENAVRWPAQWRGWSSLSA